MINPKSFTVSEELFLELVSQVYDAGLDPTRWNKTLQSVAALFQAEQANLRIIDPDSRKVNQYYFYNRDPYWVQAYKDYFYQIDPWMNLLHSTDKPVINCTHHILTDQEYRKLEIYNDYIVPTDAHFGIGGMTRVSHDFKTYLAMQKGYNSGEFSVEQLDLLRKLVPHINKSILISQRTQQLELQQNTLMQALNRIKNATILVNEKCNVLFMNTAAETLLANHNGIAINGQGIQLYSAQHTSRLTELIFNATAGNKDTQIAEAGGMQLNHAADHDGLSILVNPLSLEYTNFDIKSTKAALVILSNSSDRVQPELELLRAIYRLTKAESRVVSLLCAGLNPNEICEQLHLTLNTVKSHIKSAFHKTGTRRQTELVNLINTGPIGITNL